MNSPGKRGITQVTEHKYFLPESHEFGDSLGEGGSVGTEAAMLQGTAFGLMERLPQV